MPKKYGSQIKMQNKLQYIHAMHENHKLESRQDITMIESNSLDSKTLPGIDFGWESKLLLMFWLKTKCTSKQNGRS